MHFVPKDIFGFIELSKKSTVLDILANSHLLTKSSTKIKLGIFLMLFLHILLEYLSTCKTVSGLAQQVGGPASKT